jgi:hypothetical protein
MKCKSPSYVYQYIPEFNENRLKPSDEQLFVDVRAISHKANVDFGVAIANIQEQIKEPKARAEAISKLTLETVRKHILAIHNLDVEGFGLITTFDQLYTNYGVAELVNEVMMCMHSASNLNRFDRRNFSQITASGKGVTPCKAITASFNFVPAYFDGEVENRELPEDQRIRVELTGITAADRDKLDILNAEISDRAKYSVDLAKITYSEAAYDLYRTKVRKVWNLTNEDGVAITDAEGFFAEAPSEIIEQVLVVVESYVLLTREDAKKF